MISMASILPATPSTSIRHKKPFRPAQEVEGQVTNSMPPHKMEIFKSLENWAEKNLLTLLKPVESSWQPQDFLPDPASCEFYDQTEELRKRAMEIPDDYYVCLVGDMITEEALPTYQTMLNTFDGVRDETGSSLSPWAIWTRGWTEMPQFAALVKIIYSASIEEKATVCCFWEDHEMGLLPMRNI